MTRLRATSLRWKLLAVMLLVLAQAGFGIAVNLYVSVPIHHAGARPANYITGSLQSLCWAISHGAVTLAVHAAFGLLLVLLVTSAAAHSLRTAPRAVGRWAVLGGLLVIGDGFNGASFLDFGNTISSLIMALLALAAVACYAIGLALTAGSSA